MLSENTHRQKISSQCSLSFPKDMKQESERNIKNCSKWFILNIVSNEIMEIFESTTKICEELQSMQK